MLRTLAVAAAGARGRVRRRDGAHGAGAPTRYLRLLVRSGTAVAAGGLVILAGSLRCGSRSRAYHRGVSTSSAAGAPHDGPPAARERRPPPRRTRTPGTRASRRTRLGSYLQLSGWAAGQGGQRLDAPAACSTRRRRRRRGAQVLLRRPGPLPWAFAYAPRGPVLRSLGRGVDRGVHGAGRPGLRRSGRAARQPPADRPGDRGGAGPDEGGAVPARWRPPAGVRPPPIQPVSTRVIDLAADEAALWGDLRKKWRQYVNKARTGGVRVVDAGPERLDEFYRIYRETADRAGFLIRAAVRLPRRLGRVRAGRPARGSCSRSSPTARRSRRCSSSARAARRGAVRRHDRRPAPTAARNYLLKWEAIRSSREQGATTYDLWGLAHAGIAHFKTGFGGREIRYVGAWDLVLDPLGRRTYAVAQRGPGAGRAAAPRPARRRVGLGVRGGRGRDGADGARPTSDAWPGDGAGAGAAGRARRLGRRGPSTRPGGHVSVAGLGGAPGGERLAAGFLAFGDARALALVRPWPSSAAAPPTCRAARWSTGTVDARTARRRTARRRSRGRGAPRRPTGVDVVAADPEVAAGDAGYAARSRAAGFHAIAEIQPSRHRMALPLPADGDAAAVMEGIAKATRQRIRRAERDGVVVAPLGRAPGATGPGGVRPATEPPAAALDRFYGLLRATGDRRGFTFGRRRRSSSTWWRRRAARPATSSTSRRARATRTATCSAASCCTATGGACRPPTRGDRAERRHDHPGAMHLLRWRAIELALCGAAGPRWTSAAWTSPGRAVHPSRASRRTACTSTSARSGPSGWRSPGRTSASSRPWRYKAGRGDLGAGAAARPGSRRSSGEPDAVERLVAAATPAEPRPLAGLARAAGRGRARSAVPGWTIARPATGGARGDRGPRRDRGLARRRATGTLFVAVAGFHVDGHRLRRPTPRTPAPRPRSSSAPSRARRSRSSSSRRPAARSREAAGWWCGDPSRELGVIGVTGTDGKTTTSFLAAAALEAAGLSAPGSSARSRRGSGTTRVRHEAHVTTPGAPELQATLRAMVAQRQRGRRPRDDVARPRAGAGRRRRLRRGGVHEPHPRAPRPPRHVRALPRGQAAPVLGARRGTGQPAQGRSPAARGPSSRSSTATTRRRPGSRRPPARPGATVLTYGTDPAADVRATVDRGGRPPPAGRVRRRRRAPRRSSCGSPAGSTSTTRSRSSPWARASASTRPRSAPGSSRSRASRAGWSGSTRASRSGSSSTTRTRRPRCAACSTCSPRSPPRAAAG